MQNDQIFKGEDEPKVTVDFGEDGPDVGRLYRLENAMDGSVCEGTLIRVEGRVFDYGRLKSSSKPIRVHREVAVFADGDGVVFERCLAPKVAVSAWLTR